MRRAGAGREPQGVGHAARHAGARGARHECSRAADAAGRGLDAGARGAPPQQLGQEEEHLRHVEPQVGEGGDEVGSK